MSANATDRAEAIVDDEGLARGPSRMPPLEPTLSHHAHFDDLPERQPVPVIDIEHAPVDDDPREWSPRKKRFVLTLMTIAVLGPMISPSIYNPVIDEVKQDLHGTETQVGLSLSLYILFQGCIPVVWATIGEIVGRKPVYIASFIIYTVGSAVGSRSPNMQVLIGMRILQAMGSSAVLSSGAASLADMYEVKERGRKLGIFYGMPMLGPTLGPLIGGALGNAYGWRSTLYFLAVFAGIMTLVFIFFPDTWRRERSRVYQKAMTNVLKRSLKAEAHAEKKRQRKLARGLPSTAATPATTNPGTPYGAMTPVSRPASERDVDLESGGMEKKRRTSPKWLPLSDSDEPHPSFRDLNPIPNMINIFYHPTNTVILICSGLLFAAQYTTTYTASITFARAPYHYNPLIIGVVLLSFGVGNIAGSVLGGRWSDYAMKRLTKANGGKTEPEMRLKCTIPGMPLLIASYVVYAWTADFKTSVAGPVVALFFSGFSLLFIYSSTLAYLVDSNPGRSASAVSCNSFTRGAFACVMSQVAIPIQNAIGDGGLYTLFAGILVLALGGIVLIAYKGSEWRSAEHTWPWSRTKHTHDKNILSKSYSQTTSFTVAESVSTAGQKDKDVEAPASLSAQPQQP